MNQNQNHMKREVDSKWYSPNLLILCFLHKLLHDQSIVVARVDNF
jgi:hypothetical protein